MIDPTDYPISCTPCQFPKFYILIVSWLSGNNGFLIYTK